LAGLSIDSLTFCINLLNRGAAHSSSFGNIFLFLIGFTLLLLGTIVTNLPALAYTTANLQVRADVLMVMSLSTDKKILIIFRGDTDTTDGFGDGCFQNQPAKTFKLRNLLR